MSHRNPPSGDGDRSTRLVITEQPSRHSSNPADDRSNHNSDFFQPRSEGPGSVPSGRGDPTAEAPEQKLTIFALRLAVLEKAASGLGKLAFIWATVVLLGGFVTLMSLTDFWFVTVILISEGARIFGRSHELEWQHHSTRRSIVEVGQRSFHAVQSFFRPPPSSAAGSEGGSDRTPGPVKSADRPAVGRLRLQRRPQAIPPTPPRRTWHLPEVPMLPFAGWLFQSRIIGGVFDYLQLASAISCVTLSLIRLIEQDYGPVDPGTERRSSALNVFYSLALGEALLFLVEKAYWNWQLSNRKLLEKVNREAGLGVEGLAWIQRFFYDAYSKSINGSFFDGLKMDLISFSQELMNSDSNDEQLIAAKIFRSFVNNDRFSSDTLREIGTTPWLVARLVDVLNWKNPAEEDLRKCAAEILSNLAGKKQSALRVAAIPGAIESISSLLDTGRSSESKPNEVSPFYDYTAFNLLGLAILKKLALDYDACEKMGNAGCLLPKVIHFTGAGRSLLTDGQAPESRIKAVKWSLQAVKRLVSTTGGAGKRLRQEISEIVFTVSNIREILQYGQGHMELQKLGLEILSALAMDGAARERVGSTGGVVKLLLSIFFQPAAAEGQERVSNEAGEALAMLALENKQNCGRILMAESGLGRLLDALSNPVLRINAMRILRSLCAYSDEESADELREATAATPTVLKAIMDEKGKLLEASIGLLTQLCSFISPEGYDEELRKINIKESDHVEKLVNVLREHENPDPKVPRVRRYVIEQTTWMLKAHRKYIDLFKSFDMEKVLENVMETTSELECFDIFSGSIGLGQHYAPLTSLVDTTLQLMTED